MDTYDGTLRYRIIPPEKTYGPRQFEKPLNERDKWNIAMVRCPKCGRVMPYERQGRECCSSKEKAKVQDRLIVPRFCEGFLLRVPGKPPRFLRGCGCERGKITQHSKDCQVHAFHLAKVRGEEI